MSVVYVYGTDLRRWQQSACFRLLDTGEKRKASSMTSAVAQHEFICARAFVKTVLSRHLGDSPENVRLVIGPTGKPALAGNSTHFNLSHSGGVAIVAVACVPVGTDIEAIKLDMDHAGVADEIFSSSEVRRLNAVGAKAMAQAFFDIWTRKEAYLKATGLGFSADLKRISTATGDGTVHDQTQLSGASNWYSHELDLGEGFKAALVVVDGDPQIVVRHLAPDESMALRLSDGGWQPRQGA